MSKLREEEYTHVCECKFCPDTSIKRKPRRYIVRSYYNESEKHYCQTCLHILLRAGMARWAGEKEFMGGIEVIGGVK